MRERRINGGRRLNGGENRDGVCCCFVTGKIKMKNMEGVMLLFSPDGGKWRRLDDDDGVHQWREYVVHGDEGGEDEVGIRFFFPREIRV